MILQPQLLSGHFTLQRRTSAGDLLEERSFRNLITNRGLDLIGLGLTPATACHLSTSTAPPLITDTSMGGTTAVTSSASPIFPSANTNSGAPSYTSNHIRGFRFSAGTAVGTWSSIGVGGAGLGDVFAKTLITDGVGAPTSITILAGEILDVQYELRTLLSTAQFAGTVSGNPFTAQPFDVGQALQLGSLSSVTLLPWYESGGTLGHGALTASTPFVNATQIGGGYNSATPVGTYTTGSFTRDYQIIWPTTTTSPNNTYKGISIVASAPVGTRLGIIFQNPISKTNLQTFTFNLRYSWNRAP